MTFRAGSRRTAALSFAIALGSVLAAFVPATAHAVVEKEAKSAEDDAIADQQWVYFNARIAQ